MKLTEREEKMKTKEKQPYWVGIIRGGGFREVRCIQCEPPCVKTISVSADDPKCKKEAQNGKDNNTKMPRLRIGL